MQCPQCHHGLTTVTHRDVEFKTCKTCNGLWFDRHKVVDYLHRSARDGDPPPALRRATACPWPDTEAGFCPRCNRLLEFQHIGESALYFRKCINCSGIWIDRKFLPPLTRWFATASAYEQTPLFGKRARSSFGLEEGSFTAGLLELFADDNPVRRFPWATLVLVVLNGLFLAGALVFPEHAGAFYMTPSKLPHAPYTLLTAMFMHADIFHLAGNMYCLWVFGDNIEDRLGKFKYLILYFGCGIGADLLYLATTQQPDVPTQGASGAVSGIMGAYLVLYPDARIRINDMVFFRPFEYSMPAWLYLGLVFFGFQVLYAWLSVPGVAWFAHIGGFAAGFFSAFFLRQLNLL